MPYRPTLAGERVTHSANLSLRDCFEPSLPRLDGAELVTVDYEALPRSPTSATPSSRIRRKCIPMFPAISPSTGSAPPDPAASEKAVNDAFAKAAHVARITAVNHPLVVAAMEPRGGTAWHDAAAGVTTLRTCSQGAGAIRDALANFLKCEKGQIRVLTEDVGGAFGMKTGVYPEYTALIAAARLTGKPVHWMSSRSEAFLTDNQGRDGVTAGGACAR